MLKCQFINSVFIGMIAVFSVLSLVRTDMFSAISDMEKLIDTEGQFIEVLRRYVEIQDSKIKDLKLRLEEYEKDHTEVAKDASHPYYAFILTKRLGIDWLAVENQMWNRSGQSYMESVAHVWQNVPLPTQEDLEGAALGLVRLQQFYEIDTNSISKGILNGIQHASVMSSSDCFELGKQSFITGNNQNTIKWMEEAMERLGNETKSVESASRADILEILANATYREGDIEIALSLTEELLKLKPSYVTAMRNKRVLEKEMAEYLKNPSAKQEKKEVLPDTTDYITEVVCRGDFQPSASRIRALSCRYESKDSPFLKIAPFKLEEIFWDPYVVVFHNILSDREIDSMITTAKPHLHRSGILKKNSSVMVISEERIAKYAWFKDEDLKFGKSISQRVEDMTGLTTHNSERFQILNYGVGGHYRHHFDFLQHDGLTFVDNVESGNRIATVLFYLSNVEQGGSTVFPLIPAEVSPRKGSALFWYNLHKSGAPDYRTLHAGCPIIIGSKWIANKWLHEFGQEFRRTCGLKNDAVNPADMGWYFQEK